MNDQDQPVVASDDQPQPANHDNSGSTFGSPLFLQRLNKDGTIHSEIECKDYGLFNPLSLKKSPLQIIGAYQAILGDAFEAGFDLNCHPEDFCLRTSESNNLQKVERSGASNCSFSAISCD